ncbi:unnamed protein product [Paramecium octaurelia]|uniref:Uncharacterized protein n=1 Tax=Paramecium octaurelia TaxID=43137 RepID=A0A8S1TPE4_PAROT|nr:unnamed protein product [Paramecium octaurelia]
MLNLVIIFAQPQSSILSYQYYQNMGQVILNNKNIWNSESNPNKFKIKETCFVFQGSRFCFNMIYLLST